MHAVDGVPALHRARCVHRHAQCAGLAQQPEGELEWVDAHALGLEHRALGFALVAVVAPQFLGAHHAGGVAEGLAHQAGFGLQRNELLGPVRQVEVAAVEGVAVDLRGEVAKVLEAAADLGVQLLRGVQAPALDPLRALEPPARVLALAAAAAGAAPCGLVGLEHRRADAVLLRKVERRGHAGGARADDGHVDIDVAHQRPVVLGRRAGAGHPPGGRIGAAGAGVGREQRVVLRVVGSEGGLRRLHGGGAVDRCGAGG